MENTNNTDFIKEVSENSLIVDIMQMNAVQFIELLNELLANNISVQFGTLDLTKSSEYQKVKKEKEVLDKKIFSLNAELENANKREESYKKELLELKRELNNYKRYYGEYTSPFNILTDLYRHGKKGVYLPLMILNAKKSLNFNTKSLDYWLSVFEDLGIIRRVDNGRFQAMLDFKSASDVLYDFINKNTSKDDIILL